MGKITAAALSTRKFTIISYVARTPQQCFYPFRIVVPPSQPAPGPRLATISTAPHSDNIKPDMQKYFMIVDIKVSKDPL